MSSRGQAYDGVALFGKLTRDLNSMAAFTPAGAAANRSTKDRSVLHPFYGSELEPDTGAVLSYFEAGAPEADYKVVVVGGSVAAAWCSGDGGVLKRLLEADPRLKGRNVRVLEFAHPAYKQPQQLNRVAFLFSLGYLPDAVINLDGFNEVANGLRNGKTGTHPVYPSAPTWASLLLVRGVMEHDKIRRMAELSSLREEGESILEKAQALRLFKSSLLGDLTKRRMSRVLARRAVLQEQLREESSPDELNLRRNPELVGPGYEREEQAIIDLAVTGWFESSLSLQAICEVRGVHYVHCLQPTLYDAGSKPLTEEEQSYSAAKHWKRGVELGYDRLRERGRELAQAGVHFVDLTQAFALEQRRLYYDACHFLSYGSHLLSRQIAAEFLEHAFE